MAYCMWNGAEKYRDTFVSVRAKMCSGDFYVVKEKLCSQHTAPQRHEDLTHHQSIYKIVNKGTYVCSQCGYELFSSRTKFSHHSPWPSFTDTIHEDSVIKKPEFGRSTALKVYCGKCKQGLGHEFLGDGPNGKSRF